MPNVKSGKYYLLMNRNLIYRDKNFINISKANKKRLMIGIERFFGIIQL
jgi:hypothetical protein